MDTPSRHRWTGSRHRAQRVGALLLALGLVAALLAPAGAADAAPAPASDCPTGLLPFQATLSDGTIRLGARASSTGNRADACGAVELGPGGTLISTIQPEHIDFAPARTTVLGLLPLPTTTQATGEITGPTTIGPGGIEGSLTGPIQATASLLGFRCTIGPLTPTLTTGTSGALTGSPLVDDGTGAFSGRLVSNDFAVPAVSSSRSCPKLIAWLVNRTLGLPLGPGASSITFEATLSLG